MPPLSSPLLLLHPHFKKNCCSSRRQGVKEWKSELKSPLSKKVPICERERARERDLRLSPRAQLGLSVEFRNGMLTAHPDLSSSFSSSSRSSSCKRRRGPKTTTISSHFSSDSKDDSTGCLSRIIQLQKGKRKMHHGPQNTCYKFPVKH